MATSERAEILDDMVVALVDLLEEKGVITNDEWEKEVEKRLAGTQKSTKPSKPAKDNQKG